MNQRSEVVLVTGSSGLIGSAVVRRMALQSAVIGFDRAGDPNPPKEAECVCVDVTSEESVQAGLARVRYAYGDRLASVIHLAAYYDFSGEPSPKYETVTVRGTERLLRRLQAFQLEQFVFSSTMLVHAPTVPGQRITEESPVEARWDYPLLLGGWIALAPRVLAGGSPGVRWHDLAAGVLLILLSLPRGPVRERYGSWQRFVN